MILAINNTKQIWHSMKLSLFQTRTNELIVVNASTRVFFIVNYQVEKFFLSEINTVIA